MKGTAHPSRCLITSSQLRPKPQNNRANVPKQHINSASITAMSPKVAVIGGGLSGLACAKKLNELGMQATVFDTGKRAPGGRCSSREVLHGDKVLRFDHSVQCFSPLSDDFKRTVQDWERSGVVQEWKESTIGSLSPGGKFCPRGAQDPPLYFGAQKGNESIIQCLSQGLNIRRPVWVSQVQRQPAGKWHVFEYDDFHGAFDYLVIAHNGKCADRLMSKAKVPKIHKLLKVRFQQSPSPHQVMQLCSLWVLMVAFPRSLGMPFEGCFVEDSPDLSWIANNTSKFSSTSPHKDDLECWTAISTRSFGTRHKVPQEFVSSKKDQKVKELMMKAFEAAVGQDLPKPVFMKAQLWGAAVPMNILDTPLGCVLDSNMSVGICGDWLVAPSVEGSIVSGESLAKQLVSHAKGSGGSTGLDAKFRILNTAAIGDFPGTRIKEEENTNSKFPGKPYMEKSSDSRPKNRQRVKKNTLMRSKS